MRKILVVVLIFVAQLAFGQIVSDPTTWTYDVKKVDSKIYDLTFKCKLKKGWHIFSFNPGGDGSSLVPTFTFDRNSKVKLIGKTKENGKIISKEMLQDEPKFNYFENEVEYIQSIEAEPDAVITGAHTYQVCEVSCLSPITKKFSFKIPGEVKTDKKDSVKPSTETIQNTTTVNGKDDSIENAAKTNTVSQLDTPTGSIAEANKSDDNAAAGESIKATADKMNNNVGDPSTKEKFTNLQLLFQGIGGGLASIITPCVFAMLPMTVSFFLKRSKDRKTSIKVALQYSFSIVFIFFLLGCVLAMVNNGNILYEISTHWITNVFFFLVFLVFSFSFLGSFELTLPSSWSTFTDKKSNMNSLSGIFFMALTLSIVSFSCTIPFLGWLIRQISLGERTGPLFGFTGYGIGMALPFTLFAIFPQLMEKLNKQGGWLNAVKVTFGFIELALAFKFLSNADLAKSWRLLDREIFIGIWAAISLALALYLFGIIRFSKDSELPKNDWGLPYLTVTRTMFGLGALIFAIYLIPGMWGAPLNGMGAFIPPMGTQDFVIGAGGGSVSSLETHQNDERLYHDKLKIYEPEVARKNGLYTWFDYGQALEQSKIQKKPIFVDFTGITCVNCRKMETQVWSSPEVMKRMKENFIVVSLYCDANEVEIPADKQIQSSFLNRKMETLADLNSDLQAVKYNGNTQPYYFFIDENETLLAPNGYQYDPSIDKFVKHLDNVIAKYKQLHP